MGLGGFTGEAQKAPASLSEPPIGPVCWLCGRPTLILPLDSTQPGGVDPRAKTRDHLVPKQHGGGYRIVTEARTCRPAHDVCNGLRALAYHCPALFACVAAVVRPPGVERLSYARWAKGMRRALRAWRGRSEKVAKRKASKARKESARRAQE